MEVPKGYRYSREHTWLKLEENNIATIGITDFAQSELGEIVFVDLPAVGTQFTKDSLFGSVEAVKTTSDLFMPVSGEVIAANTALNTETNLVNSEPFEGGWMIKIALLDNAELEQLLDAEGYKRLIE